MNIVNARSRTRLVMDFVQDRLSKGTEIRLLTVLNEFTRESLCIRVERRLRSKGVRLTLEALFKDFGIPMYLHSDNGSDFIARCLHFTWPLHISAL